MKYLILAYGDENGWNALSEAEKDDLLTQDDVLLKRGDVVASVQQEVIRLVANTPCARAKG